MKHSKLLVLLSVMLMLCLLLVACEDANQEHEYTEWSITVAPTETAPGIAVGTCICGASEEFTIPALTDVLWTVETTPATHSETGLSVYTSVYGTVEVVLDVIPHEWSEWDLTDPTETSPGSATHSCACGEAETVTVPVLTDTTVWSLDLVPATHAAAGSKTYTSAYGTVVLTVPQIPHTFGEWRITTDPTETATGTATRTCECGEAETFTLPALSDTTFWTLTSETDASHAAAGEKVYLSEFGTVTVVLPQIPHTFGEWSITAEPTETVTGTAARTCECGETDTFTLPVLTDADFWAVTVVPASYNAAGSKTYTSAYGTVIVTLPKLVAPYDEKTYSDVSIDAKNVADGTVRVETAWSSHTITLGANGSGMGDKYPFRGYTVITMIDPATGRINIRVYDLKKVSSGETTDPDDPWGESGYEPYAETQYEVDYEKYTDYVGYVDFATGLIVRGNDPQFRNVFLYTPFEIGTTADRVKVSAWSSQYMAVAYTCGDTTYTFFCDGTRVWFGVTLTDAQGNAVAAEDAYNAPYLYVRDAEGNLVVSFGYNGEGQSTLDGLEGTYTNAESGSLTLSGFGTLTLNGAEGVYAAAPADAAYDLDVYVLDAEGNRVAYYQVTVGEGNTFAFSAPQVTVSFSAGEYATPEPITGAQNIPMTLPAPTHELMTFKGWFYDEACTQPVAETFVPTEDVTLYASWKAKVVINLIGTVGDDATVLYLGEGDVIGTALPVYGINTDMMKKFVGWYVDANGNGVVDEEDFLLEAETTVTAEDTNITLIAVWEDLPAYYGTYYGTELWNAGYGNSGGKTLTIDENGNISGLKTGIVVSYDPATQQVKWKTSASATTTYTFYFDAETGVIAGIYNNNDIANDYYLLSRSLSSAGKVTAHFGVKAPKLPGGTDSDSWYAQFVQVHTALGENTTLFLYNNHIYNNVSVTTTAGTALAIADIKNAKTVVVTDLSTGNVVIALSAVNDVFGTSSKTKPLDSYYGTYTNGDETVVLDGTGIITYGDKTGTYTLREDGSFDVYIKSGDVNTEYMVLTLDGAAFTMVKPTVTITFVTDHDSADAIVANKNIAITLPTDLAETGYVFKGWYVEGDESQTLLDATYMPVTDVTLVAKWASEAILTIVYNDGTTENLNVVYGVGDTATVADPTYRKHKFDGWFTTEDFAEGTEWTSGTTVTGSITIYAKWSDAPIYNNTYVPLELYGTSTNGNTSSYYSRTSAIIAIDPYGKAPKTGYPFGYGDVEIKNYDAATGYLELYSGTTMYKGYIDAASGIIVITYSSGASATFGQVMLLAIRDYGYASSQISSSYWNAGMTRAIEYTYTDENSESHVLRIFVHDGQVYFNVTFMDALTGGNAVEGKACYKASSLYVFDSEGAEIARFGYNGTTMVTLDGFEGTYTCTDAADLVLNGVDTITFGSYTGTYAKAADGSAYTFDAYVNENGTTVYYEITVNRETMTYTANKPMVEVTFDYAGHGENNTASYNKNVAITLEAPAAVEGFVFRYWYVTEGEAITSYTPTTDEVVVIHAKWDAGVSLTVVYGNGMENVTANFGAGDALDMSVYKPAFTNGMAFGGWFTDEECTVAFEATTITETVTVYCKWVVKAPFVMEDKSVQGSYTSPAYAFTYADGVWTSGNKGQNSSKSIIRITALGDITVTFQYWASSESATKWDYLYIQTGTEGSSSVTVKYTDGGSSKTENFKDGSITLTAGQYVEFVYTKDGSAAGGLDQAYIKDLAVNGTFVTEFG